MFVTLFVVMMVLIVGCAAKSNDVKQSEENKDNTEMTESAFIDGKVVTINGKTFDESDLDFYTLMNKVKITLEKEIAEDDTSRYNEQLKYYDYVNANLQSLIELYSMTLLAEEKNYFVPDEKLQQQKQSFNEKISESEEASKLIDQFGEDIYKQKIDEYIRQVMLRDRIAQELEKEIIDEHPDAAELEISYLVENKFNDLYMAQMATLEVEVHVN